MSVALLAGLVVVVVSAALVVELVLDPHAAMPSPKINAASAIGALRGAILIIVCVAFLSCC
jgi:hypothetical protein